MEQRQHFFRPDTICLYINMSNRVQKIIDFSLKKMAFIQLILIANLIYDYYHVDNTLLYLRILLINIYIP